MPEGSGSLVFSLSGYQTRKINVRRRSVITVSLNGAVSQLEQSVNNGYVLEKKEGHTGFNGRHIAPTASHHSRNVCVYFSNMVLL